MKFLIIIGLMSVLSIESEANAGDPTAASVNNFLTWVDNPNKEFQQKCVDLTGEAVTFTSNDCTAAETTGTPDNWDAMCKALGDFDCKGTKEATQADVKDFENCCKGESCTDTAHPAKQNECCATCITYSQLPNDQSVQHFVEWVAQTPAAAGNFQQACIKDQTEGAEMNNTCTTAMKTREDTNGNPEPDDWSKMCSALASFNCASPAADEDSKEFSTCCKTGACISAAGLTPDQQADCCATCIGDSQKTTTNAPAPTDAPAPNPGPTPSPSSPSESETETTTTTGPSEESTENVTEPDSAYHLGPSGLLVTLFAMMAAVVNIA